MLLHFISSVIFYSVVGEP